MLTITAQIDNGPIKTITFDGSQILTDFQGQVINLNAAKAQTPQEFSANPASNDGTPKDITERGLGSVWPDPILADKGEDALVLLGTFPTWGDWFHSDYVKAGSPTDLADCYGYQSMRFWHAQYNVPLNLSKLGTNQQKRLLGR